MATSREVPGWYEPEHTYLVHGGPVESRTDGQIHHVPALQVVRLYGLRTSMHNVVLFNALADALVHFCARQVQAAMDNGAVYHVVGPRSDGDYGTPEPVRSWQSRQRITRARDRASSGAISLPPSSTRGVTVNISSQGSGEHPGISDDRAQAMGHLREPSIATTGQGAISAEVLSNGSISTSQVSYADVLASVFSQRTDDSVMVGAPVQPPPDTKYTAKHAKLSVLLRPTRTVFGIPVQVESDGSEIFVKPRTEGGK